MLVVLCKCSPYVVGGKEAPKKAENSQPSVISSNIRESLYGK